MRRPTPERATLIAFACAVLIGGANFIAVRFSNAELPPLYGAALRFTGATVLLVLLARARGLPLPRGPAAVGAAVYGLFGFGLSYAFLYFALVGLAAGTASVIMAAVPLLALLFAVLHGQERLTTRGVVGGLLAIVGIWILSAGGGIGDARPIHFVAALLGAAAAAESTVVAKGIPRADPITTNVTGMAVGAGLLWIASFAAGESWALPETGRTWAVLGYLVVLGSVALFILFLYVVRRWTASASVYAIALMPVVAVTLGSALAGEAITPGVVTGGVVVMTAVYVGALRGALAPPAGARPAPAGSGES